MASSVSRMMERGLALKLAEAQLNTTEAQNATLALFNQLRFEKSKSVRTSTIILASFNAFAAFATAASILYDCYCASRRSNPKSKASRFCLSSIHPAETFPLILALGIFVQSLIFAAVQGFGMESRNITGCDIIAQFMFPALFIVPLIQVVFGIECAIRSLRKVPFQERGRYDVTICGGLISLLLVASWIPTSIFKQPSKCYASLVWFISSFSTLGFSILTTIAGFMLISTIIIFFRLSTVTMVDQPQRIAASRMVYYLILGILSLALVIPYFALQMIHKKNDDLKLSMIATVVLVLPGLMHGLLQLFLRSNTQTTSFSPKNNRHWTVGESHEIRMWGPNELVYGNQLQEPVFGPMSPAGSFTKRSESRSSLIGIEKPSMESLRPAFTSPTKLDSSFPSIAYAAELPATPEQTKESRERSSSRGHTRKQSYSLFPTEGTKTIGRPNENAGSVYDITSLVPPSFSFGKGHKRDSSMASSATVQIGLRLSHAPEVVQDSPETLALPSTSYDPNKPFGKYTKPALSPVPSTNSPQPTYSSPLRMNGTAAKPSTSESISRSFFRPQPSALAPSVIARPLLLSPQSIAPSINKDLPPTPTRPLALGALAFGALSVGVEPLRISTTQLLTPAVYSPSNSNKSGATSPSKGKLSPKVAPPQQRRDWI